MIPPTLELALLMAVLTILFLIGFALGGKRNTPIAIEDINGYIEDNFPTRWSAYKRGITEGYEQGLRDGQDIQLESP